MDIRSLIIVICIIFGIGLLFCLVNTPQFSLRETFNTDVPVHMPVQGPTVPDDDQQLQKLDGLINSSITCPYEQINCRKLCDGKIQVQYQLKDTRQEEIEIFDDENDFIATWNKLSQKYPSISKCINPLQSCQIDQCPSEEPTRKNLLDQPVPPGQPIPPPGQPVPPPGQPVPPPGQPVPPPGQQVPGQQQIPGPRPGDPSQPVGPGPQGQSGPDALVDEAGQVVPTVGQLKNRLEEIEQQLTALQRRQLRSKGRQIQGDNAYRKNFVFPQKRKGNGNYSVVSDRVNGDAKQKVNISQHQLIEILNKLINKRYIKPEDYSQIVKDFQNKKMIIEPHTNYKRDKVLNKLNTLDMKIGKYYNSLKKICRKNLDCLDVDDYLDLDEDEVRRKDFLRKSRSKIDNEYEGVKDLLEKYKYELQLCRKYSDPTRTKDIDQCYKSDLTRLDNRFFEQLLQYQNMMKLMNPNLANTTNMANPANFQTPPPPPLGNVPGPGGINSGNCQNKCRVVCGDRTGGT